MPLTRYLPDRHTRIGYAMTYQKPQYEDKPTVEVDMFDEGLQQGLIEAVCVALETWDPVFDHWETPPLKRDKEGKEIDARKIPVFRGRHAHKVLKFRDDIFRYISVHPTEQDKNVFLKIASKYVHIRPTPHWEGQAPFPHQDITHYQRDVIRPIIRRSDPEWDSHLVLEARKAIASRKVDIAHGCVLRMLKKYDDRRGTGFFDSYLAEYDGMDDEAIAPDWEHWRLITFYVQDIADAKYLRPEQGLNVPKPNRSPVRQARPLY
jgi:hypothetical protein